MRRSWFSSLGAARGAAAAATAAVALPAEAAAGASAQPAWVWPALIALAVVGLAVLALRIASPQQGEVLGDRERGSVHDDRPSVFVVTREAPLARRPEAAATVEPARAHPRPPARGAEPPAPGAMLRVLAARLDEVTYEAGAPNVLSLTKRLAADRAARAPATAVRCDRSDEGEDTVLSIEGTLDALTVPELAPALEALAEERRRSVTLELSGLQRLDGAGVSAIVRLVGRCGGFGGQVRVVGLGRQPRALFKLLRLDRLLQA